jgi:hypothetical protein
LTLGLCAVTDAAMLLKPEAFDIAICSFWNRFPIWDTSMKLFHMMPWTGSGIGTFGYYYQRMRYEHYTAGWFAHNDLLQFAIELGWPCALVFVALILSVVATTQKVNIVPAAILLSTFMQSCVEFQYYVPAISVLTGATLAWHRWVR